MTHEFDAEAVHRFERDTWSRCADQYLQGFADLTRPTLPLLIEAAGIGEGRDVLEVGSGPGHIAEALREAGATVTGIDFSAAMVEVARRSYPRVRFEEANAEQLPFEDDSFDAVVSNFVVHHLARPEVVFAEVRRVLRPGGRFAFTVFADPEAQSSIGAFFAAVDAHHTLEELPHGPLFGVTDLELYGSLLTSSGLADPGFAVHGITWRSVSPEPVLASFWSWADMAALPRDVQDRIEASTRERLQAYRKDGEYQLPHEILLGSAANP